MSIEDEIREAWMKRTFSGPSEKYDHEMRLEEYLLARKPVVDRVALARGIWLGQVYGPDAEEAWDSAILGSVREEYLRKVDVLIDSGIIVDRKSAIVEGVELAREHYYRDGSATGGEVREYLSEIADEVRNGRQS